MGNDRLTIPLAETTHDPDTNLTALTPFFDTNVDPDISSRGTLFTYQVAFAGLGDTEIEITTDGAASWHVINYNNGIPVLNPIFTLQVLIREGGSFNIRAKTDILLKEAIVDLI